MRVISGKWKGSPLFAPPGKRTRPTGDRVKEAVFSMVGPYFEGGNCLDLFAGSGALGLEALSRGMDFAVLVDLWSMETVRRNVQRLRAEAAAMLLPLHFEKALKKLSGTYEFDLVFLDPPYALGVLPKVLQLLVEQGLLKDGAMVVAEMDSATEPPLENGLEFLKCNGYGDTKVCIYRKTPNSLERG